MPTRLRRSVFVTLASFAVCLSGCDGDDGIRAYAAPKEPPPGLVSAGAGAAAAKPLEWALPDGWVELPSQGPGQFGRVATIQAGADPSLQLAVNMLNGANSGDLLPNLNRWENQLGLPPTPPAEAAAKVKVVEMDGHAGHRVDLTGASTGAPMGADAKDAGAAVPARLLAFIVQHGDQAWSFKLQGPPDKVAAQEAAFDQFLSSVRFTRHDHGPATDSANAGPTGGSTEVPRAAAAQGAQGAPLDEKHYTLKDFKPPSGWVQDPTPRQMRFATYNVGEGNEQASLIVTRLPRGGFGDWTVNVNRWRGEVGLPPVKDAEAERHRQVRGVGDMAVVFDFPPAAPTPDAKRSFVGIVSKGADVWFFKLIGPAKTVTEQQANFDAMLQSLQFGEASE